MFVFEIPRLPFSEYCPFILPVLVMVGVDGPVQPRGYLSSRRLGLVALCSSWVLSVTCGT